MHWLRCVLAEWQLLRARLVRSRLGLWLLLLSGGGAWLATRGAPLTILAPHLAMLGAVLGVAFSVGSDVDRAAVALTLTHPTTPLAVAAGRWLAAVTAGGILMLAVLSVAGALTSLPAALLVRTGGAGLGRLRPPLGVHSSWPPAAAMRWRERCSSISPCRASSRRTRWGRCRLRACSRASAWSYSNCFPGCGATRRWRAATRWAGHTRPVGWSAGSRGPPSCSRDARCERAGTPPLRCHAAPSPPTRRGPGGRRVPRGRGWGNHGARRTARLRQDDAARDCRWAARPGRGHGDSGGRAGGDARGTGGAR